MFREAVDGFEEEKTVMEGKMSEMSRLLQQAVADIMHLTQANAALERELRVAAAWEPTPT